jgi:hypothetical protein
MRAPLHTFAILLVLSCFAACTAVTPATKTDRAVIIKENQSRKCYGFVTAQIPSGKYEPGYRTSSGMYYMCPTKIIWGYNPTGGGIFIPDANNSDQRQAVWMSDLGSTRLFKFEPPLRLEYVSR